MQLTLRGARVTIVDPRPPMTGTSQYSTECYRNFFMDPALVPFMSRSVDIMEDLAGEENAIRLNRRGYAFLAASESGGRALERFAAEASSFGAGPVRSHRGEVSGYVRSPAQGWRHEGLDGFDLVYGSEAIRAIFPFVSADAQVLLHARRCGWLDAQGLGLAMLERARRGAGGDGAAAATAAAAAGGAQLLMGHVEGFERSPSSGDVQAVLLRRVGAAGGAPPPPTERLACDAYVNAAGAWLPRLASWLAPEEPLPLANELHAKVVLRDALGVVPQDAPFMVWRDRVTLDWGGEEQALAELDDMDEGGSVNAKSWIGPQPGGQHLRPAGNGRVLLLWEHLHRHIPVPEDPELPVEHMLLDMYPQLCLAGLAPMVPDLARYTDGAGGARLGRGGAIVDGGYYTVMPDGRPLVGRHGARNAFVCGGMGTYGLMGAPAAGELAALWVLGEALPEYAAACEWPRKAPLQGRPIDLLDESG